MTLKVLLFFCLSLQFKYSEANTFTTGQDGDWEDSATWSNSQALSGICDNDTIIITYHVNFNNHLFLSNCYLQIDSAGSLCGYDSVHLYNSQLWEYGGFYSEHVLVESSQWYCYNGYFVAIKGIREIGAGFHFLVCCGCGGHTGGGFTCTIPVQSWKDTTEIDTLQNDSTLIPSSKPPLSINVYPNPLINRFIIDSEIPDSNSHVTLSIYDLVGRKMKTISIPDGKSSLTIFTDGWAAGMYFLKFQQGDSILQTNKILCIK